jgi:hypothetical protein
MLDRDVRDYAANGRRGRVSRESDRSLFAGSRRDRARGLTKLRSRFPGARLLVFERRQSLPIGFAPAERGGAVFSLVLYPRWVRFFFLEGVAIDDPENRLEGGGNQVRSIRLDERALLLDDPYIRGLIAQAITVAGVDLKSGPGQVVLKSKVVSTRRA